MLSTPLVELERGVYAKIEYLHPSGSLKHRAIPPLLFAKKEAGEIGPDHRIAVVSAGAAAVAVAWAAARMGHPAVTVLPRSAPANVVRHIRWLGASCVQIDEHELKGTLERLEADPRTYFLSQARERSLIEHYRPVAREILAALPDVQGIVVGIGSGASITGIAREASCHVYGVEPREAAVASGKPWAPHALHGLAPPTPQVLLDKSVVREVLTVGAEEAWREARSTYRRHGLPLGPSAGATVLAARRLRARGLEGPIVAVCSCSIHDYLDEASAVCGGEEA